MYLILDDLHAYSYGSHWAVTVLHLCVVLLGGALSTLAVFRLSYDTGIDCRGSGRGRKLSGPQVLMMTAYANRVIYRGLQCTKLFCDILWLPILWNLELVTGIS